MRRTAALPLILVALGCADPAVERSAPGDVSFLIPLGGVADFGAPTEGRYGPLVPSDRLDLFEPLTRVDEPEDLYANLDVVGVRLDPCFVEGVGAVECASQIRLIMQPVFDDDAGLTTRDATIHAFYAVPVDELEALASRLVRVREAAGGGPEIGEHADPERAADEVLRYVGGERLTRVTSVAVHASDQAWTFAGFDFVDGVEVPIEPPGTGEHEQHLTSVGGTDTLDATILPDPTVEPDIIDYLDVDARQTLDGDAEDAALDALTRLLDPGAHNPGTVDCATCHMSTPAMFYADPGRAPDVYANTQNQRMFGYFHDEPSVSPRVQAETVEVLAALRPSP